MIEIFLHIRDMASSDNKKWFPLRVTYRQEMKVKHDLDRKRIECFIPMTYVYKIKGQRRIKELKPAIHNLIFVHISEEGLKQYKESSDLPIRYIMNRETNTPVYIPDKEMTNFIGISGSHDEQLIYLNPDPRNWEKGQRVKIIGGIFKGYSGRFMRIKGDRRIVVEIPGIIAIATGFIHPSLLVPIENEK